MPGVNYVGGRLSNRRQSIGSCRRRVIASISVMLCICALSQPGLTQTLQGATSSWQRFLTLPVLRHRSPGSGGGLHNAGCRGASASSKSSIVRAPSAAGPLVWHLGWLGTGGCLNWLAFSSAAGCDFHDPPAPDPDLSDVFWSLFGAQPPGDIPGLTESRFTPSRQG
jgi:hypothetical protein